MLEVRLHPFAVSFLMTTTRLPDERRRILRATVPQLVMLVCCIMLGFLAGALVGRSARVGGATVSPGPTVLLICLGIGLAAFAGLYFSQRNRLWDISESGMTLVVSGKARKTVRWDQIVELRRFLTTFIVRTDDGTVHRLFCVSARDVRWLRAMWKERSAFCTVS